MARLGNAQRPTRVWLASSLAALGLLLPVAIVFTGGSHWTTSENAIKSNVGQGGAAVRVAEAAGDNPASRRLAAESAVAAGALQACPPCGSAAATGQAPACSWQASPHAKAAGYEPSLSARELERGIVSFGARARLRRAMAKLLAGEPISVAFLGGSVTIGLASKHIGETDYVSRVFKWISSNFPDALHNLVNGGQGGTGSSYFSMCASRHVPPDADLIFLETNVNDGPRKMVDPLRLAHERMIRKLLQYRNRPAVVEVLFWQFPVVAWEQLNEEANAFLGQGQDGLGTLAQFYHLPWLSVRSLVWNGLWQTRAEPDEKKPGKFNELWHIFDGSPEDNCCPEGTMDHDHPAEKGHRWLADLIIHLLSSALDDVARHPLEPEDEEDAHAPLTAPLFKGNWEASGMETCIIRAEIKPYGSPEGDGGWEWRDEGHPGNEKWGWVSRQPGTSLVVTLKTNVKGLGPQDRVRLGIAHLLSYEHMGIYEISCAEGCTCEPLKIDGHYPQEQATQMHFIAMNVSPAEQCKLRMTVLNDTRSGEHKCNFLGVVLSEDAGWLIDDGKETPIGPLGA